MRRRGDQATDAMDQRAAGGRKSEVPGVGAQFFEVGKRLRVSIRIAAQADREIVAAVLALDPDAVRQPPDGRMVEEQSLDERLQQIDHVVVAADVRELVREDCFELIRRHPGQGAARNEHDRTQPPNDGWHFHHRGLQQTNRP